MIYCRNFWLLVLPILSLSLSHTHTHTLGAFVVCLFVVCFYVWLVIGLNTLINSILCYYIRVLGLLILLTISRVMVMSTLTLEWQSFNRPYFECPFSDHVQLLACQLLQCFQSCPRILIILQMYKKSTVSFEGIVSEISL